MVDCLTDNRNRTASQVRAAFTKHGGNLGTDGSVSYMFERRGSIVIPAEYDEDTMMMVSLDAGALDFEKVNRFLKKCLIIFYLSVFLLWKKIFRSSMALRFIIMVIYSHVLYVGLKESESADGRC